MKRFLGLMGEDLKSKLWLIVASWYTFGMFCLLFATKITLPTGEVRSLYVGPGNTSFLAAMILLGIVMGAAAFRYLYSEKKSDLYFSLPFSRGQLFWAGYLNNLLIFSIPAVVCKLLFFKLSVSMGYCRYEESVHSVWVSCLFLVLGFLLVMNLSMLAFFLAQNIGYMFGLLILLFFGPAWGMELAENMLGMFIPSFYRSETVDLLKGYLAPLSLLAHGSGVNEYVDGAYWDIGSHFPYIVYMAVLAFILSVISFLVFEKRPVERRSQAFTFRWVEWLVRYSCVVLAVLWLVSIFRIFVVEGLSVMPAVVGTLFFLPLVHGLLSAVLAFDARKFVSGGKHLLAEYLVAGMMIGGFVLVGKLEAQMPKEEQISSMALTMTAQKSGDEPEDVLSNMRLTGEELSTAYELIRLCEEKVDPWIESYELLVRYELINGREQYRKYQLPQYLVSEFKSVFSGEEFKRGTYASLRMEELKYYEVRWSNGMESYTLDLNEKERTELWEAYKADMENLTFIDVCLTDPVGVFTFASTKNQGDVTGYIYSDFRRVISLLKEYGIDGKKKVSDYEITKIVVERYLFSEGLLYNSRYLESEKTITEPAQIKEMSGELFPKEFCVDYLLKLTDWDTEYTVYYRDSTGQTVSSVACLAQNLG